MSALTDMRFSLLSTVMAVTLLCGCATRADIEKVYGEYHGLNATPYLFGSVVVVFEPHYRRLTDADLADVAPALGRLGVEDLDLLDADITDAGMSSLGQLWQLRHLRIVGTAVTPAGVMRLQKLPKLRLLDVDNTHFTPEDVLRLKSTFPETELHVWFRNPEINNWQPL